MTAESRPYVHALKGELDLSTQAVVLAVIDDFLLSACCDIELDVTGVEFIDSSGLSALLLLGRRASERGGQLWLVGPSRQFRRVLALTNLERLLPVREL